MRKQIFYPITLLAIALSASTLHFASSAKSSRNSNLAQSKTNFVLAESERRNAATPQGINPKVVESEIIRLHYQINEIVPPNFQVEKVAEGFTFIEGPIWIPEGYLLFSDTVDNVIYKWTPDNKVSIFRHNSGYSGSDTSAFREAGSNGLTLDSQGRLTINELGNRRVTRLEADGQVTVMADKYEGKKLNSPNDLVYKSDGSLYFTDPPFGLLKTFDDPNKELPFSGVYRVADGKVKLINRDLTGPNGLAFSHDEKHLYVGNWNVNQRVIMRYEIDADGNLSRGKVFVDMADTPQDNQAPDGMKVDKKGNLYIAGPGGVWIVSPEGEHLGLIRVPELPANMAWGDSDGKTLYLTARSGLYRVRLNIPGVRP